MAQSISESAESHEIMSLVRSEISCFLIKIKLNEKKLN